jgi:hypothetical protein
LENDLCAIAPCKYYIYILIVPPMRLLECKQLTMEEVVATDATWYRCYLDL